MPVTRLIHALTSRMAVISGQVSNSTDSSSNPNCTSACEYVPIPDGSSSTAPQPCCSAGTLICRIEGLVLVHDGGPMGRGNRTAIGVPGRQCCAIVVCKWLVRANCYGKQNCSARAEAEDAGEGVWAACAKDGGPDVGPQRTLSGDTRLPLWRARARRTAGAAHVPRRAPIRRRAAATRASTVAAVHNGKTPMRAGYDRRRSGGSMRTQPIGRSFCVSGTPSRHPAHRARSPGSRT